ncbi:hypothetical protein MVEG_10452 [Podila verticillata NRRL 6337]|nr:hypothetical protein MVEG_10452 [Podila verticillata NRRL 6337]
MLAVWTESISATLVCTSPSRLTGMKAGSSLVLGFSDNDALSSTSAITAQLICSANGSVALTLGSGYDSTNYTPNSPIINITEAQVSAAIQACPSNSFHVQYVGTALLGRETAKCTGNMNLSLGSEALPAPAMIDPPAVAAQPNVGLPLLGPLTDAPSTATSSTPTTTVAPTSSRIVPTTAPPPPTTTTTTTTTAAPVTSGPVSTTTTQPPVVPPVVPPVSTTTTTISHTTTSAKPTQTHGNGSGNDNGNGNGNGNGTSSKPATSTSANSTESNEASDLQQQTSSSAPSGTIIGACAGVVGGVCAILAGLLVWRKRQQKKIKFDQFYDDSLAAASGFGSKPIYGREDQDEEQGGGPGVGAVVPLNQAHTRSLSTKTGPSQVGSPPPLAPVTPAPVYDNAYNYEHEDANAQQDNYYNDQYHTYRPYQLPYQQPYQAYNQNQDYYDYQYEMKPTDHAQSVHGANEDVSVGGSVGYYPKTEYGREYEHEQPANQPQRHKSR